MSSTETYFNKLKDKLSEKDLNDFWIICGRSDFKPIKNIKKKEMQNYIKTKTQYYAGKNLANISIVFRPRVNFNTLKDSDWLLTIKIYIYNISSDGEIDTDESDTWSLIILYNKDELNDNHFTLNELNQMIQMGSSRKIISDMSGISYSNWIKLLAKKIKKISSKRSSKK